MAQEEFTCSKPDCTYAITGTCLESIDDPTQRCPNLKASESLSQPEIISDSEKELETPNKRSRQFPSGLEIGLHDAARLMRSRYTRVVGVLGQSDAGKTCLFTSLYLQLTNRHLLPRYRFAGSDTLQGFEQRARHLRDWSTGDIPDQIVDHTSLGNSRSPSFLHIAVQDDISGRYDFLLPDLPGEWTTRLLSDATTASRFNFLLRSDVILIVLEAPQFAGRRTRNNALADATHLVTRLADEIKVPKSIPLVLAVTKCDQTDGKAPTVVEQVAADVSARGYKVATISLAAFPKSDTTVRPGHGIDALIDQMTSACPKTDCMAVPEGLNAARSFLKARGHQ